ncbi:MAG: glycosyltransferase, partial [Chitinispirillaceae bacterium]|nr:glycosyltransferase [Chitinispirillaceae bacterium]
MKLPLVSIVIVNWNGKGIIEECLESLYNLKHPTVEIVVVDNSSTDSSLPWLRSQSNIKLIENKKNEGFAKGSNIGFSYTHGKYVISLNSDMVVESSWLEEVVDCFEYDKSIGIIASRQMRYYEKDTID